ncbi:MAG: hypothetical protein NZ483_01710 [Verrucomicrobiae bacterium]|nr:hypothetical protein [Verrucomicrobiae bacterium]
MELITVGAVLGLVAALLLPALARARERARQVVCAGNLRQVGQLVCLYYDRYERLPVEDYPGYLLWDGARYVLYGRVVADAGGWPVARVFYCPSGREFPPHDWDTGIQNLGIAGQITACAYWGRSPSQGAPSRLDRELRVLVTDWLGPSGYFPNHAAGVNALRSDGAVQFRSAPSGWNVTMTNGWGWIDDE